jgi:hypothetical protein
MFVAPAEDPLTSGTDFRLQNGFSYSTVGVPSWPLDPALITATNPRVIIPTVDFNGNPRPPKTVGAFAQA